MSWCHTYISWVIRAVSVAGLTKTKSSLLLFCQNTKILRGCKIDQCHITWLLLLPFHWREIPAWSSCRHYPVRVWECFLSCGENQNIGARSRASQISDWVSTWCDLQDYIIKTEQHQTSPSNSKLSRLPVIIAGVFSSDNSYLMCPLGYFVRRTEVAWLWLLYLCRFRFLSTKNLLGFDHCFIALSIKPKSQRSNRGNIFGRAEECSRPSHATSARLMKYFRGHIRYFSRIIRTLRHDMWCGMLDDSFPANQSD